ncbi:MAG: chromosomal replication initiator protein DnaA [Candidatus Sumerlaeales bacterium]|nr:chromosomal replication initiator protein DnaA [Candidatus Sumerlaeales bacterium]
MQTQLDRATWSLVLDAVKSAMNDENAFNSYIAPLTYRYENDFLVLSTSSSLGMQLINSNYIATLKLALSKFGIFDNVKVVYEDFSTYPESLTVANDSPQIITSFETISHNGLIARYKFDNFIIGECNKVAYLNAYDIAISDNKSNTSPNQASLRKSLLFIYGRSGVGKTHLMHAIGNEFIARNPDAKVLCVTCEQFINTFIDSIRDRSTSTFREVYRSVNLLMIDDVQMIAKTDAIQQELFNVFNSLYEAGQRIVFTSDRPPKDLNTLFERLRTRLAWGLTVDIQTPELETRVAILMQIAEREHINVSRDIIMFIAENVVSNVRELEGAMSRILAYARLDSMATCDLEVAKKILLPTMGEIASTPQKMNAQIIMDTVSEHFKISNDDLVGNSRIKRIAAARHIAQYIIREYAGMPFPKIAEKFGGRDHTSVIYACRKIAKEMETDENLKATVLDILKKIKDGRNL